MTENAIVVAKIDKDWLFETLDAGETSNVGKEFHYEAMKNWWGWKEDSEFTSRKIQVVR